MKIPSHRQVRGAVCVTLITVFGACGDDTEDASDRTEVDAPATTSTGSGVTDADWRREVGRFCGSFAEGLTPLLQSDGTAAGLATQAEGLQELAERLGQLDALVAPDDLQDEVERIIALGNEANATLVDASDAAATGDVGAAQHAIDLYFDYLGQIDVAFALSGAQCTLDPAPVAAAQLNVPVAFEAGQLEAGFGSIWVSQKLSGEVVRIEPDTGEVLAVIDVGPEPLKLQPADGRMWVRTRDSYVAIDPETNTVDDALMKSDVGPEANRSWAVDGGLWICDGRTLHHYDPTTLQQAALIPLDLSCGQVYATHELVVAWSYNEDEGQSGVSAATMIDPATDQVLATIDLPVDVGVPVVRDELVFFPGFQGATAVVVDRATWSVAATPDLGRSTGGSQTTSDAASAYIPTDDDQTPAVLVVDASTFEVTGSIKPLGVNSVTVLDGALWVAAGQLLQRFELR